jgi:hypothetical protein
MPAPIPTLSALWRPNQGSTRDDRELIRGYALWPLSAYNLTQLTAIMNRVADTSAATVAQVQAWMAPHTSATWSPTKAPRLARR